MADPIRIPVVVELDAATGQLQKLRATADREVGATARTVETQLRTVETAATKTAATTVQATAGMGKALHGVGPAVSAMSGAFAAAGAKIPAGLGAITTGISSLISTGIGPLGLAMAGVTAAIALFGSSQASAASGTTELTDALKAQRAAFSDLLAEVEAAGRPAVGASATARLGARLAGMRDLLGMAESFAAANPRTDPVSALGLSSDLAAFGASSLDELRSKINMAAGYLAEADRRAYEEILRNRKPLDAEYQRERNAEVRELLRAQRGDLTGVEAATLALATPRAWESGEEPASPVTYFDRLRAETDRARADAEFGRRESERSADAMMRAMIEGQEREQEIRDRYLMGESIEPAPRGAAPASVRSAPVSATAETYTQTLNRSLSQSVEGAMIGGISSALSDPGNWQGALESFAGAIQSAVTTRIASGLVDALMGNTGTNTYGIGGIIGSIVTAWIGGSGGDTTTGTEGVGTGDPMAPDVSGDGPAKMASTPIVVVNTYDESFADATVSRASAAGFRVGLAKASGGGVSRGTIPSRGGR